MPDNVLLSHGNSHTTIGAKQFHFWVRYGIRWYLLAKVIRQAGVASSFTLEKDSLLQYAGDVPRPCCRHQDSLLGRLISKSEISPFRASRSSRDDGRLSYVSLRSRESNISDCLFHLTSSYYFKVLSYIAWVSPTRRLYSSRYAFKSKWRLEDHVVTPQSLKLYDQASRAISTS